MSQNGPELTEICSKHCLDCISVNSGPFWLILFLFSSSQIAGLIRDPPYSALSSLFPTWQLSSGWWFVTTSQHTDPQTRLLTGLRSVPSPNLIDQIVVHPQPPTFVSRASPKPGLPAHHRDSILPSTLFHTILYYSSAGTQEDFPCTKYVHQAEM